MFGFAVGCNSVDVIPNATALWIPNHRIHQIVYGIHPKHLMNVSYHKHQLQCKCEGFQGLRLSNDTVLLYKGENTKHQTGKEEGRNENVKFKKVPFAVKDVSSIRRSTSEKLHDRLQSKSDQSRTTQGREPDRRTQKKENHLLKLHNSHLNNGSRNAVLTDNGNDSSLDSGLQSEAKNPSHNDKSVSTKASSVKQNICFRHPKKAGARKESFGYNIVRQKDWNRGVKEKYKEDENGKNQNFRVSKREALVGTRVDSSGVSSAHAHDVFGVCICQSTVTVPSELELFYRGWTIPWHIYSHSNADSLDDSSSCRNSTVPGLLLNLSEDEAKSYLCSPLQGEENTCRHEEKGEVVMVTEHRVLDAGNRKGHIVIRVSTWYKT